MKWLACRITRSDVDDQDGTERQAKTDVSQLPLANSVTRRVKQQYTVTSTEQSIYQVPLIPINIMLKPNKSEIVNNAYSHRSYLQPLFKHQTKRAARSSSSFLLHVSCQLRDSTWQRTLSIKHYYKHDN